MAVTDIRQVIHDLRNRIAPIRNVLYLIRLRGISDEKLEQSIAVIERQVEAMSKLLDDVSAEAKQAAAPDPAPGAEAGDRPAATGGGKRILIADDSPAVCESFGEILRDLGHEVRVARDGLEAVDIATAWMPDFAMIDVNMPKLNGYETARRLRAQFPSSKMRLVMISGATLDASVREAARQAGFDQCLDKMLDFDALNEVLAA
jgi:CheY-like chemotaxis protein